MKVTDYYGRIRKCITCQSEEIEKYFTYTPPFRNALDTVFICGCAEHVQEAQNEYNKQTGIKDRINTMSSNT